ncbi:MAG: MBL fold metallo-hydrolase [Candidatus Bathyarchaeota archaeon]|nr:MAG: MBL fold metallo-hydrolase [Candidatus Bathyarchaeota archaeon]
MIFRNVTQSVYLVSSHPDSNVNVTAFNLPKRIVLIDCGMRLPAAVEVRKETEAFFKKKVDVVILTHFHSDHTAGLPAFSDCRIISSRFMLKNLKETGRKVPEGFMVTFPNKTFDNQLKLRYGDVQFLIKRTGGHTDGSAYVYCPDYKVVVTGDNLTINFNPWGGAKNGDPDLWIRALQEYLSLAAEFFIPGHGPVGGKDQVKELLDYIEIVRKVMMEMIVLGKTEEEIFNASRKIEYIPSRKAHPSTLKRWHKVFRARAV